MLTLKADGMRGENQESMNMPLENTSVLKTRRLKPLGSLEFPHVKWQSGKLSVMQ